VATDFVAIHDAIGDARGEDAADAATAAVLADGGVLDPDAFALTDDRLADADPADVAAIATTVAG